MKEKWLRFVDYATKKDPYLYYKYDYLVGMTLFEAQKELPRAKITAPGKTRTLQARHDEIMVTIGSDGFIEGIDSIYTGREIK